MEPPRHRCLQLQIHQKGSQGKTNQFSFDETMGEQGLLHTESVSCPRNQQPRAHGEVLGGGGRSPGGCDCGPSLSKSRPHRAQGPVRGGGPAAFAEGPALPGGGDGKGNSPSDKPGRFPRQQGLEQCSGNRRPLLTDFVELLSTSLVFGGFFKYIFIEV